MGIQAAPEIKFALIREATLRDNNLLKISKMCEIAGVSRATTTGVHPKALAKSERMLTGRTSSLSLQRTDFAAMTRVPEVST